MLPGSLLQGAVTTEAVPTNGGIGTEGGENGGCFGIGSDDHLVLHSAPLCLVSHVLYCIYPLTCVLFFMRYNWDLCMIMNLLVGDLYGRNDIHRAIDCNYVFDMRDMRAITCSCRCIRLIPDGEKAVYHRILQRPEAGGYTGVFIL